MTVRCSSEARRGLQGKPRGRRERLCPRQGRSDRTRIADPASPDRREHGRGQPRLHPHHRAARRDHRFRARGRRPDRQRQSDHAHHRPDRGSGQDGKSRSKSPRATLRRSSRVCPSPIPSFPIPRRNTRPPLTSIDPGLTTLTDGSYKDHLVDGQLRLLVVLFVIEQCRVLLRQSAYRQQRKARCASA